MMVCLLFVSTWVNLYNPLNLAIYVKRLPLCICRQHLELPQEQLFQRLVCMPFAGLVRFRPQSLSLRYGLYAYLEVCHETCA